MQFANEITQKRIRVMQNRETRLTLTLNLFTLEGRQLDKVTKYERVVYIKLAVPESVHLKPTIETVSEYTI